MTKVTSRALETVSLLPEGTDIATPVDVKINKAEIVNVITVGVQQKLSLEVKEAEAKLSNIKKSLKNEKRRVLALLADDLSEEFTESPEFWNDVKNENTYGNTVKISFDEAKGIVFLTISRKTQDRRTTIKNGTFVIPSGWIEYSVSKQDKKIIKLDEEREAAENTLEEAQNRYKSAGDTKVIKAQLDMRLLANTKNGEQLVKNTQALIKDLSEGLFAKEEPKKLAN